MSDERPHPESAPPDADAARKAPASAAADGGAAGLPPAPADPTRRALAAWLWRLPGLAAVGGAAFGAVQASRIHFAKDAPDANPSFAPVPDAPVAPLAAFPRTWDSVDFVVSGIPCVAVRLPQPVPGGLDLAPVDGGAEPLHLAAFSRICTHLSCIVELNRDLEAVAFAFNHRSDRPSLTCSCHYSVFDPLRAGRAVSGPAVRPLPRARLRLVGDGGDPDAHLVADGIERTG